MKEPSPSADTCLVVRDPSFPDSLFNYFLRGIHRGSSRRPEGSPKEPSGINIPFRSGRVCNELTVHDLTEILSARPNGYCCETIVFFTPEQLLKYIFLY